MSELRIDGYLTTEEAADLMECSRNYIRVLYSKGLIPPPSLMSSFQR
ncbi:MAG: DNA-binding protein [Chloroflexi bacterium]|nr:DNA-binding protein [Chloroflexota bacterium]